MESGDSKTFLRWIKDEQVVHQSASFGGNKRSVKEALEAQLQRDIAIKKFEPLIREASNESASVGISYEELKKVSEKRLHCLHNIAQIASLEDLLGAISTEFSKKASDLVALDKDDDADDKSTCGGKGTAAGAQNCILAVQSNWSWISKLSKCSQTHLDNASEYHKFFHEIDEIKDWMPATLAAAENLFYLKDQAFGDKEEINDFTRDLKEILTLFQHWTNKLNELWERSQQILPVSQRNAKCEFNKPVISLCNYQTKDINIKENEELLLIDNKMSHSWKVRNLSSQEAYVPSVILVIPLPDGEAVLSAQKMRQDFVTMWTMNVKRIGKNLILLLILIFRNFNDKEMSMLRALPQRQKEFIFQLLERIRNSFLPVWNGFHAFDEFLKRADDFKNQIEPQGSLSDQDLAQTDMFIEKLKDTDQLLRSYALFWKLWDSYRITVQAAMEADCLLIVEKLEQMKYVNIDDLRRMWQAQLKFGSADDFNFDTWMKNIHLQWQTMDSNSSSNFSSLGTYESAEEKDMQKLLMMNSDEVDADNFEEDIEEQIEMAVQAEVMSEAPSSSTKLSSYHSLKVEKTATEELMKAESEERKTFVITGVVDPQTSEEVSMQQAVLLGVINPNEGTYVNSITGVSIPIPEAMNQGLIKVEFTTSKKTEEKKSEIGLVTIETHVESRPYTVMSVIDANTDQLLTVDEAIRNELIDMEKSLYFNKKTNECMSLSDALDSGLLNVEYDNDVEVNDPEVVSKTYAIHHVIDQRRKTKVTFLEAVKSGLIDKENGSYHNNVSGEIVYVSEAIKRGYIKAFVVTDPQSLDIDDDNKMVQEKIKTIRKKLLNPLKAMNAFKNAGK